MINPYAMFNPSMFGAMPWQNSAAPQHLMGMTRNPAMSGSLAGQTVPTPGAQPMPIPDHVPPSQAPPDGGASMPSNGGPSLFSPMMPQPMPMMGMPKDLAANPGFGGASHLQQPPPWNTGIAGGLAGYAQGLPRTNIWG